MSDNTIPDAPNGELILFQSAGGTTRVECRFESDTLWLSQAEICTLYGKAKATISEHISHVFKDGECIEDSVVRFYRTTATDGKPYSVSRSHAPHNAEELQCEATVAKYATVQLTKS